MSQDKIEESTFLNAETGEKLNVCYENDLVFFTFYNAKGKPVAKGVYDVNKSEDKVKEILEQYVGKK